MISGVWFIGLATGEFVERLISSGGNPYYLGPSYNTTSSGSPVNYWNEPRSALNNYGGTGDNAIYLRRFRTAIPTGPGARQVTDDDWAREYSPGIGFQLGEEEN